MVMLLPLSWADIVCDDQQQYTEVTRSRGHEVSLVSRAGRVRRILAVRRDVGDLKLDQTCRMIISIQEENFEKLCIEFGTLQD